jgi:hypothetical protein
MGIYWQEGGLFVANNVWVALVFAAVSVYLWGQSIIGVAQWQGTQLPVAPALQAGMAPFGRMWNGVSGCFSAIILRVVSIICFAIAFYVFFFGYGDLLIILAVLFGAEIP